MNTFLPNNISGALYHRVMTSIVNGLCCGVKARASPKSAIFKPPSRVTNIFWGFKSLLALKSRRGVERRGEKRSGEEWRGRSAGGIEEKEERRKEKKRKEKRKKWVRVGFRARRSEKLIEDEVEG